MLKTLTSAREDLVPGMAESDHAATGGDATQAGQDTSWQSLAERKSALRRRLLAARAGLTVAGRDAAGRALRDAVLALPEAGMAGTVAAYLSAGTEPATTGLVYALWKRGSYVLLPVLREDDDLDWACYEGPGRLAPGRRGILEPASDRRGPGAIASADLVIVPALAVDRVHSIQRAVEVGSVDEIVSVARLRPAIIDAIERGLRRSRDGGPGPARRPAGNAPGH